MRGYVNIPTAKLTTLCARSTALALATILACASSDARLGLPSTATPEELAEANRLSEQGLDYWLVRDARLQHVAQRIRIAGAPLCKDEVNPILGLAIVRQSEFPRARQAAAARRFPDGRLYVTAVFEGMAAERAGVQPGDVLVAVDGRQVYKETQAYKAGAPEGGAVEIEIERAGKQLRVQAERVLGCAYSAGLIDEEVINAFAQTELGTTAYFTALVRELQTDSQLALVVGHELAHNMINRLRIAQPKSSVDHEARADYVGAYLAARAGFSMAEDQTELFDVLNRGNANTLERGGYTHPLNAARVLAFKQALAEIRAKQAQGLPLMPEIR